METKLLLGLMPGSETETSLLKIQSLLVNDWPLACALPPVIPLFWLSGIPVFEAFHNTKQIIWPRMDVLIPDSVASNKFGNLCLNIDELAWMKYRDLVKSMHRVSLNLLDEETWLSPGILLALGPGLIRPESIKNLPVTAITINAPFLVVIRLTTLEGNGFHSFFWELLARHRVSKLR